HQRRDDDQRRDIDQRDDAPSRAATLREAYRRGRSFKSAPIEAWLIEDRRELDSSSRRRSYSFRPISRSDRERSWQRSAPILAQVREIIRPNIEAFVLESIQHECPHGHVGV